MARPRKAEGEKYIRQDISMEPGQFRRLMAYCQREDRSISWVIRKALEMFLEEEDMDELDILRSENEALRMRLAEIRDRINGMELPHEYHILYNRGWHDAVEEVRRYIE